MLRASSLIKDSRGSSDTSILVAFSFHSLNTLAVVSIENIYEKHENYRSCIFICNHLCPLHQLNLVRATQKLHSTLEMFYS